MSVLLEKRSADLDLFVETDGAYGDRRLQREFLDRGDRGKVLFSLAQTPAEVAWGPKTKDVDHTGHLCWWTTPVTTWAVGYLVKMVFSAETREPVPRVVLSLELVRPVDEIALERCMRRARCVISEYFGSCSLLCGCIC